MTRKIHRGSLLCRAALAVAVACCLPIHGAHGQTHDAIARYSVPAGDLAGALDRFSAQTGLQLVYRPALVAGKRAPAVSGSLTWREALERILRESGLEYVQVNDSMIVIKEPQETAPPSRAVSKPAPPPSAQDSAEVRDMAAVAVTGTRIRGAQPSSPLIMITQEDIRLSGHNSLGEVIRNLPQNFNGGQNPALQIGITQGESSNRNTTGGSGFNLRGLGPDATLTLLNGARLPYDGFIQATDASVIPVAAIERVDVLLDGASALYGSDAVGGVVNIVLKREYDGAEVSARFGTATDGGYGQRQYTAVAGRSWRSGGFLVSGDISHSTSIRARQRDYLAGYPSQDAKVHPDSDQKGITFSGHQALWATAEATLDAFYTKRNGDFFSRASNYVLDGAQDSTIWGLMPALHFELPRDWSLAVRGGMGKNESTSMSSTRFVDTGVSLEPSGAGYTNRANTLGLELEGALFALPGGDARLSVGGGRLEYSIRTFLPNTGRTIRSGKEENDYLYGEINLPLLSSEQNIPLVESMSINGSVRRDSYDSFGTSNTPKIGVIWNVVPSVGVRANWGKSFKAPTLDQRLSPFYANLNDAEPYPGGPVGRTVILANGGNPNLEPEHAEAVTAGLVLTPQALPGFDMELGWFSIRYTDRVTQPIVPTIQALANPAFAPFVLINPTVEQLNAVIAAAPNGLQNFATRPYDPANVYAVIFNQNVNALAQRTRGYDVRARYSMEAFGGNLVLSGNASWVESRRSISAAAPDIRASGVTYFPAEFRGRLSASWFRDGLAVSSFVNHTSGVENNAFPMEPRGASMTTMDLVVNYEVDSSLLGEVGFNFSVMNVFNGAPPFRRVSNASILPYDGTNYSALGRMVSLALSKRF